MRGLRALIGGVADRRRGAMTVAVTRRELGAGEPRREAARCRDARAARRMLALALVLEGASREEAARAAGMDRQTLREWVHRYNEEGLDGLSDRRRPGPGPRLTPEQEAELATAVERGPDPERDGVVRWRRVDLQALIETRFTVRLHERSVGKVLRRLGFARLSVRPRPGCRSARREGPCAGPAPPACRCVPGTRRRTRRRRRRSRRLRRAGGGSAARARPRQAGRGLVPGRGPGRPAGRPDPGLGAPRHPAASAPRPPLHVGLPVRRG